MSEELEVSLASLQIWIYQEHTFEEVKTKFEQIRKELDYTPYGLLSVIKAGRVDLFADPPLLPVRPALNASDVSRIIDEMSKE